MKLKFIGSSGIRLSPHELTIKPGDIIEDPKLVALLKDHPLFEAIDKPMMRENPLFIEDGE